MPSNLVKPGQEADWDRAKAQAEKAGHKEDWPYVNAIFQKMIGKSASVSPAFLLALRHAHGKTASVVRYDERFLATNGKWYLILGNNEHDEYEDSTAYGPFPSEEAVDKYARRFSNSGGGDVDDSGRQAPPTKSPNGGKLVSPTAGGYGGGGSYYGGGSRWAEESAQRVAAAFLSRQAAEDGLADKIRALAAHYLDRPLVRYNKGTLSFTERGAKGWAGSETYSIPELLRSPRAEDMSGDVKDFLTALHKLLLPFAGEDVEVPSNIAIAWLTPSGDTDASSFNLDLEYKINTHYDRRGFYGSTKTSANPPLELAAKADEAVGQAYRDLVSLKLGFDSWEELPESAAPLYRWLGKAISSLVEARQMTTNVREMVRLKKF